MVSTRQMTIGNSGTGDRSESDGPAKFTRNSTAAASFSQPGPSTSSQQQKTINFLDLPQEIIEKIFTNLSYKNTCQLRLVCTRIDRICGNILNTTFQRLQTQLLERFQTIKRKMPRRESARRNHHLACESDIIETLHMRLTLLQMSLGKHIERKHCCFFPGEILDEVFNILHYIKTTPKLARPYKVTDELFDLSTMAMEYFKEKIEPDLPEIAYFSTDFLEFSSGFPSSSTNKYLCLDSYPIDLEEAKDSDNPSHHDVANVENSVEATPQSNMVLRKRIRKIKQGMKRYNSQLSLLRQDLRSCKRKTAEQQKQISEQQKQLAEQQKQTLEYATRLDENDKKNEEISRKFSTLLQELNKCKTELQYWRSKSPATPPFCTGCGNVIVPHPEELEALVNQGVNPEGLGLEQFSTEFMPITTTTTEQNQPQELNAIGVDQKNDEIANCEEIPYIPTTNVKKRKFDEIKDTITTTSIITLITTPSITTTTTTTTPPSSSSSSSLTTTVKKSRRMLKTRNKKTKI